MKRISPIVSLLSIILVYGSGIALWVLIFLAISASVIYFTAAPIFYFKYLVKIISMLFILKVIWGIFHYLEMYLTGKLYFYGDFTWEYRQFYYSLQENEKTMYILIISVLHSMIISAYISSLFYLLTGTISIWFYVFSVFGNSVLNITIFWLDNHHSSEHDYDIILNSIESLLRTYHFLYGWINSSYAYFRAGFYPL